MWFLKRSGLFISLLVLLVSCGTDKNFGDGKGITSGLDLKTVLDQTMDETSVLAVSLRRDDDTPIEGAHVALSFTQGPFTLLADEADTNELGLAGNSVSRLSYAYRITDLPAGVGEIITTRVISLQGTSSDKFRASNVVQTVTANDLLSVQLDFFRVSSNGVALDFSRPTLTIKDDAVVAGSTTLTAELFSGVYRVRIQGQTSTGTLVTQISSIISAVGAGVDTALSDVELVDTGKQLDISLQDETGLPIAGRANGNDGADDIRLIVFDAASGLEIGRYQLDVNGQVVMTIATDITDILVVMADFSSTDNQELNADVDLPKTVLGFYRNENFTDDDTQILSQTLISGRLQADTALDAADSANILLAINNVPSVFAGKFSQLESTMTAAGADTFSVALFEGSYTFDANSVKGFPAVTAQTVDVPGVTSVNIPVATGGQLSGVISDEAGASLADVQVAVYEAGSLSSPATAAIAEFTTLADGAYSFELAAGDYDLWVNGAVTENIAITQGGAVTQDIRRFTVNGSVRNINNQALDNMKAFIINGATTSVAAGAFSLPVFEGLNALCYRPAANQVDIGLECHFNVMVDQTAVDRL